MTVYVICQVTGKRVSVMQNSNQRKSAAARKVEITKAAQSVLASKGASALTLRAVASEVGIKLASLQYHFPNYASLISAICEDVVTGYRTKLQNLKLDINDNPSERLLRILKIFTAIEDEEENEAEYRFQVQLWALALTDKRAAKALDAYYGQYLDVLSLSIADVRLDLDPEDVRARATAIASMIEGSVMFVDRMPQSQSRSRNLQVVYDSACKLALG